MCRISRGFPQRQGFIGGLVTARAKHVISISHGTHQNENTLTKKRDSAGAKHACADSTKPAPALPDRDEKRRASVRSFWSMSSLSDADKRETEVEASLVEDCRREMLGIGVQGVALPAEHYVSLHLVFL